MTVSQFPIRLATLNTEQHTIKSGRSDAYQEERLSAALHKKTGVHTLPSVKMQAWCDYEVAKFGVTGRRGSPETLAYNLYDDSTTILGWSYRVLTDDPKTTSALTGFTERTIPRRALGHIAEAFGFRYLRGLLAVESALTKEADLAKFRHERIEFRHKLEVTADAAHAINDKGQNREAALGVVVLFADELLALCPWLMVVGQSWQSDLLRNRVHEAIGINPQ